MGDIMTIKQRLDILKWYKSFYPGLNGKQLAELVIQFTEGAYV